MTGKQTKHQVRDQLVESATRQYHDDVPESFFIGTFVEILWESKEIRMSIPYGQADKVYTFDSLI